MLHLPAKEFGLGLRFKAGRMHPRDLWTEAQPLRGVARTRDERPNASFDFSEHFRQRIDRRVAEPRIRISLASAGEDGFGLDPATVVAMLTALDGVPTTTTVTRSCPRIRPR